MSPDNSPIGMSVKLAFGISINPFSTPSDDNFAVYSPVPLKSALLVIFVRSSKLIPDMRMSKAFSGVKGKGPVTVISVSSRLPSAFNSPASIVQLSTEFSNAISLRIVSVISTLLFNLNVEGSVLFPLNVAVPERCPVLLAR